jgi:hypothetical protein
MGLTQLQCALYDFRSWACHNATRVREKTRGNAFIKFAMTDMLPMKLRRMKLSTVIIFFNQDIISFLIMWHFGKIKIKSTAVNGLRLYQKAIGAWWCHGPSVHGDNCLLRRGYTLCRRLSSRVAALGAWESLQEREIGFIIYSLSLCLLRTGLYIGHRLTN